VAKSDDNNTLYKGGGINRLRRIFPDDDQSTVELPLLDSVAQEPSHLSGVRVLLYSLRRAKNMHPLYREPTQGGDFDYAGPWELMGVLDFDQGTEVEPPDSTTEGTQIMTDARLQIARKEFEDKKAPDPKAGDVIEFWSGKEFEGKPFRIAKFKYWDVNKANRAENIWSTETFLVWMLELKHKTRFDAARKVQEVTP
jgi:hypothetical protein